MAIQYTRLDARVKTIAEHYGPQHQLHKAREELLEAVEAIDAVIANPDDKAAKDHLAEELADVGIMADQVGHLCKIRRAIRRWREFKITRQLLRMKNGG